MFILISISIQRIRSDHQHRVEIPFTGIVRLVQFLHLTAYCETGSRSYLTYHKNSLIDNDCRLVVVIDMDGSTLPLSVDSLLTLRITSLLSSFLNFTLRQPHRLTNISRIESTNGT